MKTHGPNSPGTARGLLERRRLRGVLDTRRRAEADIRTAEYVGPFGKGFHWAKNPGGSTPYIVADQTGGRTFAPSTAIMLGSNTGMTGGEAVLGGAPAGKKGGITRTRSPRRRGSVAVDANQYAFSNDASNLLAMLYSDGVYVSTRATVATPSETVCGIILTDDGLLVGDGSALLSDGAYGSSIKVWDVENTTMYSYSVAAGWMLHSWPVYNAGAIYWAEIEDGTGITGHADSTASLRLRTALTDLTGDTTITTLTLTATDYDQGNGMNHYHGDDHLVGATGGSLAVDSDGAVIYHEGRHQEPGHGVIQSQYYQFRVALPGGSESHRDFIADTYPLQGLFAATKAAGGFIFAGASETYTKTDDAALEATLLHSSLTGTVASINVGLGGVTYQVFNNSPFGIWRNGSLITATIESFDGVYYPQQMFYFGD